MKLSFSTLGCPTWSVEEICEKGKRYGYDGVGIRGIQGELDLTKMAALSERNRAATVAKFRDAGLEIVLLGSSCRFTLPAARERRKNLEDGKAAVDLAEKVGAKMVRVYGGVIGDGVDRDDACNWVAENLAALGDYARGRPVVIAVETHDDFTDTALLRQVVEQAARENVRVLWDIGNCYRAGETSFERSWQNVGRYVVHTHFKDSRPDEAEKLGFRYCLMGEGDVPNRDALRVLKEGGYEGYLSFEWEKVWHPELEEAEVVFPQYVVKMREYLAEL